ncbi:DNA-directed RNA polymerase subunit beta [Rickettsiales bacterium LUAb2]
MKNMISDKFRLRKDYSKIKSAEPIPDLMEVQKSSYAKFLQMDVPKAEREDNGLEGIFSSIFPMYTANGAFVLEYVDYYFDTPKYSIEECKHVGATYAFPLKVKLRLISNRINQETGDVAVEDIKEQEVYFGDVPLMLDTGTFVINGTERVVVSQIHRSPGVFFGSDKGKNSVGGKVLYSANIIPKRGSWLDVEFDAKDLLYAKIDKRKKFLATILLKCLYSEESEKLIAEGKVDDYSKLTRMSNNEILSTFYDKLYYKKVNDNWVIKFIPTFFRGKKLDFDLINFADNKVVVKAGTNISAGILKKLEKENLQEIIIPKEEIIGKFLADDLKINDKVSFNTGDEITIDVLEKIEQSNVDIFHVLLIDNINVGPYILNTLKQDKNMTNEKALKEMYRMVKSTEPPSLELAEDLFTKLFFDLERYDLSEVGRVKINERLKLDQDINLKVLNKKDIIEIFKTLIKVRDAKDAVDDIDHLGNRRIRSVGELIETEVRIALVKMQKSIVEKMSTVTDMLPNEVVNVRPLQAVFKEFFGVSQLSQFMDQTNPLSEITHKRRLSALGPKGLSRDRAGFEVRDVHHTHYGRICPIETPEGPNIGLINSLTIYARINQYGFLETPYRKVENGKILEDVVYLTASQEKGQIIAQSSVSISKQGVLTDEAVSCRQDDDFIMAAPVDVHFIDISPKQLVSVAASLVPFLENDDANRALMGANMQRQAVPLLLPQAPLVGTGMEGILAQSSGSSIISKSDGIVDYVDADRIIVKKTTKTGNSAGVDVYNLNKFQKSNHNTCINQRSLVKTGDIVKKNAILADGQSCDRGELALGKNVLVAFMPWNGYNFEDSILVSERVVTDDVFTSIHIEEFEIVARDTKLGAEEITSDIPGVGEEALRNLDEAGIVYIGAEVKTGDILVGKITPKAESIVTPEEKLLRAIFGEKAMDVRDTSLRVPSGVSGTVIGVRVFSRRGLQKDTRSLIIEKKQIEQFAKERDEQYLILVKNYFVQLADLLNGQEVVSSTKFSKGTILKEEELKDIPVPELFKIVVQEKDVVTKTDKLKKSFESEALSLQKTFENKINKIQIGDDLPSNVLKMVKVYVAVKRKLQPGDKMAGRHGNKGVVSRIVAVEDMPYLEDGTPVDICLNPLGVPSRMNIGQILEIHLGWASAKMGQKIYNLAQDCKKDKSNVNELRDLVLKAYEGSEQKDIVKGLTDDELLILSNNLKEGLPVATPVFDGLKEKDINELLDLAGLDTNGQVTLIDGRTGEPFERKVTVGYMYMLKLHHLVDDKIHARSIGPYSLITQQPLGGKAQFGGQRFGEMEVWALEAYGAAYILKEMLTVKSDDQVGRTKVYEAIIRGEETFETGIPESFNVLVKELRSLGLDMDMQKDENK